MALEFREISVSYGEHRKVIKNFSWKVEKGEFWSVIGPNGAGKTTILRTLLKRTFILSGNVRVDGRDIRELNIKEIARKLAILLQTDFAEKSMTVREYVSLGRHIYLKPLEPLRKEDLSIVEEALSKTKTLYLRDRRIGELSSGELQRVRIARVIAQGTDYILLDEPTSHLDYEHRFEIMELLSQLNREGKTIIAILHEFDLAYRYGQKILVVSDGQIVKAGDTKEIFSPSLFAKVFHVNLVLQDGRLYIEPLL